MRYYRITFKRNNVMEGKILIKLEKEKDNDKYEKIYRVLL